MTTLGVHGNAAQIQHPTTLSDVVYSGLGLTATLKAGTSGWIHLPFPSPDIELVPRLTSLVLNFSLSLGYIDELSIYDGDQRIHHENNVNSGGYLILHLSTPLDVTQGLSLSFFVDYKGDKEFSDIPAHLVVSSLTAAYDYKIVATKGSTQPNIGAAQTQPKK
jgi:hypothetical protein